MSEKIHFIYNEDKQDCVDLAHSLIADIGQTPKEEANIIVTVGGDGLALYGLRRAEGSIIYPITPPTSNSHGFWTDHSVRNSRDLLKQIENSTAFSITPLKVQINFSDKTSDIRHAFNDVSIERSSGQAALMFISACFNDISEEPVRVMGDGFIFSTAMGSTGSNRSYGGPMIDITNNVMILTGKGIFPNHFPSVVVNAERTSFHVEFGSVTGKRPVRIDYDGLSKEFSENGAKIVSIDVCMDEDNKASILLPSEPGLRALSALK